MSSKELDLIAYRIYPEIADCLTKAPPTREWMNATDRHFANRCLPLVIANQSGWFVINNKTVIVTWNGGTTKESIEIVYPNGMPTCSAMSHFGSGILTWSIPYIFRTPLNYNLLVRGPANMPKDGITALEGIVETDWTCSTFTMNWKLTRPSLAVTFNIDEPICMLVPQLRGELTKFRPAIQDLTNAPDILTNYNNWATKRSEFNKDLTVPGSKAVLDGWQKDYFRGNPSDTTITHEQKLNLCTFEKN